MIELHADEKIMAVERRHWMPMALESISLFVAGIIPFLALIIAEFLPRETVEPMLEYRALAWFFAGIWLMGSWIIFAILATNYYLDVLVVTTKRLIDVEQIGLFSRDVAEIHLSNIEDIRIEVSGFVQSLLNYGYLHIQSAAENREFSMKNIKNPNRVKDIIFHQQDIVARGGP